MALHRLGDGGRAEDDGLGLAIPGDLFQQSGAPGRDLLRRNRAHAHDIREGRGGAVGQPRVAGLRREVDDPLERLDAGVALPRELSIAAMTRQAAASLAMSPCSSNRPIAAIRSARIFSSPPDSISSDRTRMALLATANRATKPRVADGLGGRGGLVDDGRGLGELAGLDLDLPEIVQQLDPRRRRRHRAGRRPGATGWPPPGGRHGRRLVGRQRRAWRRAGGDVASLVVDLAELASVAIRLLEVVAEDLLELLLAPALAVDPLGPAHETFVELRSRPLEQGAVRSVLDHQVAEPIEDLVDRVAGIAARRTASDPTPQVLGHRDPQRDGHQLLDGRLRRTRGRSPRRAR